MSVDGKVALITGATSGVGRGIATEFARRGAKVVAAGRRETEGKALADEVTGSGHDLTFVRADVTDEDDAARMAQTAIDVYGRLDILICNAGTVGSPAVVPTHEATLSWWQDIIDTNLTGSFLTCRAALPHLVSGGGGSIFAISSMNAQVPFSRMAAYNASKAGLAQLIRTIAIEYLPMGIRANAVTLGAVSGGTNRAVNEGVLKFVHGDSVTAEQLAANAEINEALEESPERIGAALALLASDELATMTAGDISMDRGVSAGMLTDLTIYKTVSGQWSFAGN